MSLRDTLLTEYFRLKRETEALSTLLSSRGWLPEEDAAPSEISYVEEARNFINGIQPDDFGQRNFTSADFVKFLHSKHGVGAVNEASARGVFRLLEANHLIKTETPGRGRQGAIYLVLKDQITK